MSTPLIKNAEFFYNAMATSTDLLSSVLHAFWEKLSAVQHFTFQAHTPLDLAFAWNGQGQGQVILQQETSPHPRLIFNERGTWQNEHGIETIFHNVFRWTLNLEKNCICLEHLRQGPAHPVFLFDLLPSTAEELISPLPHLCGADTYSGKLSLNKEQLQMNWHITGPRKNTAMCYFYS